MHEPAMKPNTARRPMGCPEATGDTHRDATQRGRAYEAALGRDRRKELGSFYTPEDLVGYMLDRVELKPGMKILDPSCGTGFFLVPACRRLTERQAAGGLAQDAAHKKALSADLYGLDIDPEAVRLAQRNLALFAGTSPTEGRNVFCGDFLDDASTRATIGDTRFDLVIGNPPYSARIPEGKSQAIRQRFKTTKGRLNTATLFVERAIEVLKDGGVWALILPNSVLRVWSYQPVRQFILDTCALLEIADVGEAFAEADLEMVVIIARKESVEERRRASVVRVARMEQGGWASHTIPQSFFYGRVVFPIYVDEEVLAIVRKMEEGSVKLAEIASAPRGLPISVNDRERVSDKHPGKGWRPAITGRDIASFRISTSKYLRCERQTRQAALVPDWSEAGKIVIQNIGNRITAAYDTHGRPALDTVNIVRLQTRAFDDRYVLAILNSSLMKFYLDHVVINRSHLTVHLDLPYVGQIPIKRIPLDEQREMAKLVSSIERSRDERTLSDLRRTLDERVYGLYGLTPDDVRIVLAKMGRS